MMMAGNRDNEEFTKLSNTRPSSTSLVFDNMVSCFSLNCESIHYRLLIQPLIGGGGDSLHKLTKKLRESDHFTVHLKNRCQFL